MGAAFAFGELVAACVGYIMLDDLETGNWRGAMAWLCLPAAFSLIYLYFKLEETARFLYSDDRDEEG